MADNASEDQGDQTVSDDPRRSLPSASSFGRLVACPGSRAMEKGLPELKPKAVTDAGERIHAAMESGDDEGLEVSEKEITERLVTLENHVIDQWKSDFQITGLFTVVREERWWARRRDTLELAASAQGDMAVICAPYALLADFKSGFKEVIRSELNWQVKVQAVTFWHEHPEVTHIRAGILASRLHSRMDFTDFTESDLRITEREIFHAIWRSEQPDSPLVPGPHCQYCKAHGVCRPFAVHSLISSHRAPVLPNGKPDGIAIAQKVALMTPPELAFVMSRKTLATEFFEAVSQRMKGLDEQTLQSIGYELRPGNMLKSVNAGKAFERLKNLLSDEERLSIIKLSLTKAAELLSEREKGPSLKKAKEMVLNAVGDAVTEYQGNPRLTKI